MKTIHAGFHLGQAALLLGVACSSGNPRTGFDTDGGMDAQAPKGSEGGMDITLVGSDVGDASGPCTGLKCQVHACTGGGSTTVSGTVYDPAAKNPLYDIVVFVPNSAPQPFKPGVSCDTCKSLYTGDPITTALTDSSGKFTLENVPDGSSIPLVVQVGKWRKQLVLPTVKACQDNPLPDKSLTLPKNHTEGDIPNIAISTGGFDTLECLLSRIGLDSTEYEPGAVGPGRLHVFHGDGLLGTAPDTSPPAPSSSAALWDSASDIDAYDMVLLSCEGMETKNMNQGVLFDYAAAGGRVFASHFHYAWFDSGPFGAASLATWTAGIKLLGKVDTTIETKLPDGKPFPKGEAMDEWLGNVGALTGGQLPVAYACHNADVGVADKASLPWIVDTSSGATEYFSFNTPLTAAPPEQCGRVVYSDIHVGAASSDHPLKPVPQDCADVDLSPQEKALEFMLFDLAACVTPNGATPVPPPPK
jgi:hypothetical protein